MPGRNSNISNPLKLNTDNNPSSLDSSKTYTFALNARVESEDGNAYFLTNDESNTLDIDFKDFVVIGKKNISEISKTILFLTNNKDSIIAYEDNSIVKRDNFQDVNNRAVSLTPSKTYEIIVKTPKLNFSTEFPIHKIAYKINKDKVELYWTDNNNKPGYLDLSNIPLDANNNVDVDKMSIFPEFNIPDIDVESILNTGSLKAGSYQLFVAYANSKGEEVSQYYSGTNPIPIFEQLYTVDKGFTTSKSINVKIKNIDTSFKWVNIAVAETVEGITTYYLIATLDIKSTELNYLFTGQTQKLKDLSISDILYKSLGIVRADILESQNNYLMIGNIETNPVINCQSIASKLTPKWISYRLPYNGAEGYSNGVNSEKYRSYMRDEVYPLEFVPIFKGGIFGSSFHIPGRKIKISDTLLISNKDTQGNTKDKCDTPNPYQVKWKVYNTARSTGLHSDFVLSEDKECYIGPYEMGEFAYWESTEVYPDNKEVYGDLVGQHIRHHKFPDELVSSRYSIDDNGNEYIYPLGVYIDPNNVYTAIQESDLTQEEKDSIIGFKIIRGNRANNSSIVAKGLVNNIGKYKDEETSQEFYFANYPYNDVRKDPYFATTKPSANMGLQYAIALDGFKNKDSKENFIFYSPDTLFNSLPVVPGLQFKIEDIEYGESKGHFVPELNNAKHKFISHDALKTAIMVGVNMGVDYSKKGLPSFNGSDAVAMIASMRNLFENLLPYENFGYSYHSIGTYNNKFNVPNSGNKLRSIEFGKHVTEGLNGVKGDINLNHLNRESGVFLSLNDEIPFTHEFDNSVPMDVSRYIPSTYVNSGSVPSLTDEEFFNLCKTDKTALVYATLGVVNAYASEYGGENNLLLMVTTIASATFSDIIENKTYSDLLEFADYEDLQFGQDPINVYHDIAWPGTNFSLVNQGNGVSLINAASLSNNLSPYRPWIQNSSAYKCTSNTDISIYDVSEVVGIPPIGKVKPTDAFLFYYVSSDLYSTRDDAEGEDILTYWPPDDPRPWNQQNFEWGPYFYLSQPYNYTPWLGDANSPGSILAAQNNRANGQIVHEYHGWATSSQGTKWPWGAGTLSANTTYFKQKVSAFYSTKNILWGKYLNYIYRGFLTGKQMYYSFLSGASDLKVGDLGTIRDSSISSYYASIKRNMPNQWGSLFSFERVDTGHLQLLYKDKNTRVTEFEPVFGGDTYINKFALKIKNSIYRENIVGYIDGTELPYNKLGNYGYPMFWISSEPLSYDYHLNAGMLSKAYAGLGLVNKNLLIGNILSDVAIGIISIGSSIAGALALFGGPAGIVAGGVVEIVVLSVSAAVYVAGLIFTHKGNQINKATFSVFRDLLQQMLDNLGIKNLNLDFQNSLLKNKNNSIGYSGVHYLFSYGISSFFVESDINVDYRQAENTTDKDFYPNVGNSIPDDWLMESNVPIKTDNYYMYDPVYSKQNISGLYRTLPRDYSKDKEYNKFPTRVIYSEQSNQEEIEDNWKIFKANNYFDFPLTSGKLIDLNALEENKVLARFENNSFVYNAYIKMETSDKISIIGGGDMFSTPPMQFSNAEIGYLGSQHKAFVSCKYGYFFLDSKRGNIFHLKGGQGGIEEISREGMRNWFKENLPFKARKSFKDINIDNSFDGIGICMVWDNRFERLFVTKKDYELINTDELFTNDGVLYKKGERDRIISEQENLGWKYKSIKRGVLHFEKVTVITKLPTNTDIHAYFDTTSTELPDAQAAYDALTSWFQSLQSQHPTYQGQLYTIAMEYDNSIVGDSNMVERWLAQPNLSFNGWDNVVRPGWESIHNPPPNYTDPQTYVPPEDLIILSFSDETDSTVTGQDPDMGYHAGRGSHTVDFSMPPGYSQPTLAWNEDLISAQITIPKFKSFQGVLYPIPRMDVIATQDNVLQMVAALYGRTLSPQEIQNLDSFVDLSLLETTNPYNQPLKDLGYKGLFNKKSPASEVFSSETFGQELTELLDFGGSRSIFTYKDIELTPVKQGDPDYYEDRSWTMSYSPVPETKGWISYHSFLPNYYIEQEGYFQSGIKNTLWGHGLTNKSYQTYYNQFYNFEVECITKPGINQSVLQSVQYRADTLFYKTLYDYSTKRRISFDQAEIYSMTQASGILNLVVDDPRELYSNITSTLVNQGINVSLSNKDDLYKFNSFYNIVIDSEEDFYKYDESGVNKSLVQSNIDYDLSKDVFNAERLRSDYFKVKLKNTKEYKYKMIFKWLVDKSIISIR